MTLNQAVLGKLKALGINPTTEYEPIPRLPTGSLTFDYMLGGGLPMGRYLELFGWESTGKTTAAQLFISTVLKNDPEALAVLFDAEHSYDFEWGKKTGIDESRCAIIQAASDKDPGKDSSGKKREKLFCAEDVFDQIEKLLENQLAKIIVVDSIAALAPRAELEGSMDDNQVAAYARRAAQFYRKTNGLLAESGAVLIMLNQMRSKIGVTYGDPTTTPGGNAKNFYSSIRIRTKPVKTIPDGVDPDDAQYLVFSFKTVKNKTTPSGREASVYFRRVGSNTGIDPIFEIVQLGKEFNIFTKADGTPLGQGSPIWHFNGKPLAQGAGKVMDILAADQELKERCYEAVKAAISIKN